VTTTESAELVRRFYESWTRRDLDVVLESVDPEFEFDWSNSRSPFSGVYEGREGLERFWTDIWDAWDEFRLEIEEVRDCGHDCLVAASVVRAQGKGSGIEVEAHGAMLWTLRAEKLLAGTFFQTKEEALAAAEAGEVSEKS
jgi:ketosteroid isomerase-like protein